MGFISDLIPKGLGGTYNAGGTTKPAPEEDDDRAAFLNKAIGGTQSPAAAPVAPANPVAGVNPSTAFNHPPSTFPSSDPNAPTVDLLSGYRTVAAGGVAPATSLQNANTPVVAPAPAPAAPAVVPPTTPEATPAPVSQAQGVTQHPAPVAGYIPPNQLGTTTPNSYQPKTLAGAAVEQKDFEHNKALQQQDNQNALQAYEAGGKQLGVNSENALRNAQTQEQMQKVAQQGQLVALQKEQADPKTTPERQRQIAVALHGLRGSGEIWKSTSTFDGNGNPTTFYNEATGEKMPVGGVNAGQPNYQEGAQSTAGGKPIIYQGGKWIPSDAKGNAIAK